MTASGYAKPTCPAKQELKGESVHYKTCSKILPYMSLASGLVCEFFGHAPLDQTDQSLKIGQCCLKWLCPDGLPAKF